MHWCQNASVTYVNFEVEILSFYHVQSNTSLQGHVGFITWGLDYWKSVKPDTKEVKEITDLSVLQRGFYWENFSEKKRKSFIPQAKLISVLNASAWTRLYRKFFHLSEVFCRRIFDTCSINAWNTPKCCLLLFKVIPQLFFH